MKQKLERKFWQINVNRKLFLGKTLKDLTFIWKVSWQGLKRRIWFTSLDELKLITYNEIKKTQKTELLQKRFQVIRNKKLWTKLSNEFNEKSGGDRYSIILQDIQAVIIMTNELQLAIIGVRLLELGSVNATKILSEIGLNPENATARINTMTINLNLKKSFIEQQSKGQKSSDFYTVLSEVESILNRNLDINNISCSHWIAILNNLSNGKN